MDLSDAPSAPPGGSVKPTRRDRRHARGVLALTPALEGDAKHEPDHDDHRCQTEEDEALTYLRAKIVRLVADDSHMKLIPGRGAFHSCSRTEGDG
jgi:hypothetical protein